MNNRPAEVTAAIEVLQTRCPGYQTAKETLLAYIETLEAANGWRPIGEAPKDGTEILVYQPERPVGKHATVVWWENGKWAFVKTSWYISYVADKITHWQPLPTPPSPASKGE